MPTQIASILLEASSFSSFFPRNTKVATGLLHNKCAVCKPLEQTHTARHMTFSINTMWCHFIPFDTTLLVRLVFRTFTKYSVVSKKSPGVNSEVTPGQQAASLSYSPRLPQAKMLV